MRQYVELAEREMALEAEARDAGVRGDELAAFRERAQVWATLANAVATVRRSI